MSSELEMRESRPASGLDLSHLQFEILETLMKCSLFARKGRGPFRAQQKIHYLDGSETFTEKWLKPRLDSGLDWLVCAEFARQRW